MRYFQKIMRQDKERFVVPKSVQQTIPCLLYTSDAADEAKRV